MQHYILTDDSKHITKNHKKAFNAIEITKQYCKMCVLGEHQFFEISVELQNNTNFSGIAHHHIGNNKRCYGQQSGS